MSEGYYEPSQKLLDCLEGADEEIQNLIALNEATTPHFTRSNNYPPFVISMSDDGQRLDLMYIFQIIVDYESKDESLAESFNVYGVKQEEKAWHCEFSSEADIIFWLPSLIDEIVKTMQETLKKLVVKPINSLH